MQQLDEQRNEMEKKFAEEFESNSSILSRQQREITKANDVKAALRKEANHAKAMLDDLQAVQAVLQRDTEKAQTKLDELKDSQKRVHQEVHREQAELHNLKATKRRLEQEVDQDKERVEDLRRTRRRLEKEVDQEKEGVEDLRRTRRQLEREINELRDARERDMRGRVRWQSPIRSPRSPAVHAASTNGSYHRGRPAVENERRRDDGIRLERHRVGDGFHRGDVIRVCKRSHEDDHGRRHAI
jgi:chromosome segregation ATPase